MTRTLALLGFALTLGGGMFVLTAAPAWLITSLNRGSLWAIRDELSLARISGALPEIPAVDELIHQIEGMILAIPWITPRAVARVNATGSTNPSRIAAKIPKSVHEDQRMRLIQLENDAHRIVLRQYFLGSWSGLLRESLKHRAAVRVVIDRDRWHSEMGTPSWGRPRSSEAAALCETLESVKPIYRVRKDAGARRQKDLVGAS